MKKAFKRLLGALALVLCLTLAFPANLASQIAFADGDGVEKEIVIEGLKSTVLVGADYVVPKATTPVTGVTITVKDMYGDDIGMRSGTETADVHGKFEVTSVNTFSVTYEVEITGKKYSQTFSVRPVLSSSGVYFKFSPNESAIIPSKIAISANNPKIYIPTAVIYDKDDEEVSAGNVTVSVKNPNYGDVTVSDDADGKGRYILGNNLIRGMYVFTYKYYDNNGMFITSMTKEMQVIDAGKLVDGKYENVEKYNNYKLGYELSGAEIENAVTGVTRELPAARGINQTTGEYVEVYYTVKAFRLSYADANDVKFVEVSNETFRGKKVIDGNEFTPNDNGTYKLEYTVKDLFGHTADLGSTKAFEVSDTEKPTPVIWSATEDRETYIQAKFDQENVIIPAISAKDNFSELSDFRTLRRRVTRSGGQVMYDSGANSTADANKDLVFNMTDAYGDTLPSTQIEAKYDSKSVTLSPGSYTVFYYAVDKAGNEQSINYSFEVATGFYNDDEDPEVSFVETFYGFYNKGEEVRFTPTVTDNVDKTLRITTSYEFSGGTAEDNVSFAEGAADILSQLAENEELNFNNKKAFKVTIPEVTTATTLTIKATATDYKGNVGEKVVVITIKDTGDAAKPVVSSWEPAKVGDPLADQTWTPVQGDEVKLPKIVYTDDKPEYMEVEIVVTHIASGTAKETNIELKRSAKTYVNGTSSFVVEGASFDASFAGNYVVKYVAKDGGDNYLVKFFTYTSGPSLLIEEPRFSDSLPAELNDGKAIEFNPDKSFRLPAAEVLLPEDTDLIEFRYELNILVDGNRNNSIKGYDFTAKAPGTYKIVYEATIQIREWEDGVVGDFGSWKAHPIPTVRSKEFTLKVEATVGPVIREVEIPAMMDVMDASDTPFIIPKLQATTVSGIDLEKSTIVITSSRAGTTTIKLATATASSYEYRFTRQDEYRITYTAYDIWGLYTTKTYTVKVGDTVPPTIDVEDNIVPETVKRNTELEIDLGKIKIEDNIGFKQDADGEELDPVYEILTITVRNKTTDKLVDPKEGYKNVFLIEDAGSYVVTFEVMDAAGWTTTIERTFEVSTNDNEGWFSTEVIGIILIIVASLVFAGAVVYFIISSRNIDKKDKKIKTVKSKKGIDQKDKTW